MPLKVNSEIGKLSSVLVHLPGPEIDRMVPSMMEELLFDDILFGAVPRGTPPVPAGSRRTSRDEVVEVQDLLDDVLQVPEQRAEILAGPGGRSAGAPTWTTGCGT